MSLEEACALSGKGKDWVKATEEELLVGAFGEGISGMTIQPCNIIVDMDSERQRHHSGLLKQHLYLNSCGGKLG